MKIQATSKAKSSLIGKDELIHQIAGRTGATLATTAQMVEAFTEVVAENLAAGREVRVMGFGTWLIRQAAGRKVRDIRSGESIQIAASQHVAFKTGAVLAKAAHRSHR